MSLQASPIALPLNLHDEYRDLLSKTAHILLKDEETDELCQTIFEILRGPLKLDVYFHYLVTEDKSRLELASSGGNDVVRAALGSPLNFGQAVCGTVAERCEWMYVPGVQSRSDTMTELIRSFGIRCYACQPLVSKREILGTLSFGSSRRDSFDAEEIEVFRIVSEQVTLATERRIQNRRMQQLEREAAAGRMCATLAHEVNNPLESLGNLLYLLRTDSSTSEGRHLLAKAEAEVRLLSETTQRTLNNFRGKREELQLVDVASLLDQVVSGLRSPRQAAIDTELEPGLCVKANTGEMRQVFFNLIINATHFSPAHKKILVSAKRKDAIVEVLVKDEGPGIPEDVAKRLFQPFFTTREQNGTGLGLWISKDMVQRAGGSITFESNPLQGPGTTFFVNLPLMRPSFA